MTAFAEGGAAKVPVLIGTNRDEFTLFVALQYLRLKAPYTAARVSAAAGGDVRRDAAAVAAHYPLSHYGGSVSLAYSAAVTDGVFACVADRMAEELAPTDPVYAYEFNDRDAPAPEPLRTLPFPVGASHSLELRYLFDVGGAPPLEPRPAGAVRPDDRLLEPVRPRRATPATTGPAVRRPRKSGCRCGPTAAGWSPTSTESHQCAFWAGLKE